MTSFLQTQLRIGSPFAFYYAYQLKKKSFLLRMKVDNLRYKKIMGVDFGQPSVFIIKIFLCI